MLRAAGLAEERDLELRVVRLPEGKDPADLVAAEGARGGRSTGSRTASSILEFAVGRSLEDADLETPEGRDRALARVRALIAPRQSAARAAITSCAWWRTGSTCPSTT